MDPTARFADLVKRPEGEMPLDEASLLIAAHAYPDLDVSQELQALDALATGVPPADLESWRRHLFVELGFSGNVGNYYDPDNSFLHKVVRRRMGLPITLSVLAMEVGRRVGLEFEGVGMPGHFLLRHPGPPPVYVDPFDSGVLLDRDACVEKFQAVNGADAVFEPEYLDPVGRRTILARMLANLKSIYGHNGDLKGLKWVITLRVAIPGVPPLERRDLARVLGSAGEFGKAASELESLAEVVSHEAPALLAEATALRARLN